jgi:cell division FtsZ-interacting protein ZapD
VDARAEIDDLLEASPSLRTELDRDVERQTQRGIDLALRDLGRYQEVDAETIAALRATSYTVAQVLGDWFPEEPRS